MDGEAANGLAVFWLRAYHFILRERHLQRGQHVASMITPFHFHTKCLYQDPFSGPKHHTAPRTRHFRALQ